MRKIIRWGTPRKANPKYEKISRAPGISKWECKKSQGNHILVFVEEKHGFSGSLPKSNQPI